MNQNGKISVNRIFLLSIVIAILIFYFLVNPLATKWMPQCVFHKITGLQCMGCGAQRMIHSLLHGEIMEAMKANFLLFFSLPFLAFLLWAEISRTTHPHLYKKLHSLPVIISVAVVLSLWLIIRNLLQV